MMAFTPGIRVRTTAGPGCVIAVTPVGWIKIAVTVQLDVSVKPVIFLAEHVAVMSAEVVKFPTTPLQRQVAPTEPGEAK